MQLPISVLEQVLAESKLSPEQLGMRMGISGMTIRRWMKDPESRVLAPLYCRGLLDCVHQLLEERRLKPDSPLVRELLAKDTHPAIRSALFGLGISPEDALKPSPVWEERMIEFLARIGSDADRHAQVLSSAAVEPVDSSQSSSLARFMGLGDEWKNRITGLVDVVRSERIPLVQKLVAVGALFYLITPFDLIPDHIPIFGLMDDYAVLGLATAYYARKLAHREASAEITEIS